MKSLRVEERRDEELQSGWWSRERISIIVLFAATALALYLCYLLARPLLPAFAWALALSIVAHPLHDSIARRLRHPNLAAALAVAIVAVIVIGAAVLVARPLLREAAGGVQALRTEVATGRWQQAMARNPYLAPALRRIEEVIDWKSAAERVESAIADSVGSWLRWSVWTLAELLITFFSLFYFFRDRAAALRALRALLPLTEAETNEVLKRVKETIFATIYGTLVVAFLQGLLGGLIFWWLGLPAPVLWGTVMGLLATVPTLGAFVVWAPAAIFLALEGSWSEALMLALWGGGVVSLIDNLLYPVLVGKRLRLHTLLVFVAIVGGLVLFGASGLILGPVILAVTVVLIDVWRRRTAFNHTAERRPELGR